MEYVYHIVAIRVNKISWAHVWRLRSHYLRTGCDRAISGMGYIIPQSFAGGEN
jgi:hypothetical protein